MASSKQMSAYCAVCKSYVEKTCDGSTCSCELFVSTVPLRRNRG